MKRVSDTQYLRSVQYRDSTNLDARIALHARFSVNPQGWQRWVFEQIDLTPDGRLLELGCGSGALWAENLERIPPGWEIFLSDISIGMATQVRKNLADRIETACFLANNAQAIPFPKASFNAIIANHMLYHVPNRERALAEIQRVLQPGGRLYATTGGERHLAELYALVQKFDPEVAADGWYLEPLDFTLENGQSQLSAWFNSVQLLHYEDALVVTQAEPLVDYILSTVRLGLGEERRQDLLEYIQAQLDASGGAIHITKEGGMFIAYG
jgi:SAM-dependent methyltransferase